MITGQEIVVCKVVMFRAIFGPKQFDLLRVNELKPLSVCRTLPGGAYRAVTKLILNGITAQLD